MLDSTGLGGPRWHAPRRGVLDSTGAGGRPGAAAGARLAYEDRAAVAAEASAVGVRPNASATSSYDRRRAIIKEHELYQKGLMYYLANDPGVPEPVRTAMGRWGLAKDESLMKLATSRPFSSRNSIGMHRDPGWPGGRRAWGGLGRLGRARPLSGPSVGAPQSPLVKNVPILAARLGTGTLCAPTT